MFNSKIIINIIGIIFFSIKSYGQDTSFLNLANIGSLNTSVSSVQSEPCNSEKDCCENKDTVLIKKMNIEIQTYYRSGVTCDPYLSETIIIKNESGCIEKYSYKQSLCDSDDWFCDASWRKKKLTQEELQKLVENHLSKAKKIFTYYSNACD